MINIWKEHIKKYPEMEIQDMLKLIYQSEFGGGHMIAEERKSLGRIEHEYELVKESLREDATVCEVIGKDMGRIYLNAITDGLCKETLNKIFVFSANEKKGRQEKLEEKLALFIQCCQSGELPFDPVKAKESIDCWKEEGYPAKSHSESYRQKYCPAYRVVKREFCDFYSVFLYIDQYMAQAKEKTVLVHIDGMAGSGKSTLAGLLKKIYDCNLFHMDDYFLQPHQRTKERLSEPGGNVDYERFQEEILDHLDDRDGFTYQIFDCGKWDLGEKRKVSYKQLNIVEGVYCNHPYFNKKPDLAFFMEIDKAEQRERIQRRNGTVMLERFLTEWVPMEHRYFDKFNIREKCICMKG